jgi:predicted nucleotidyltransferase
MVRTEAETRKMIEKYINYLKKEITVNKVILYGSYAKGTAMEDSNADIAIESPDFATTTWLNGKSYIEQFGKVELNLYSNLDHYILPWNRL